mgnify:CR=1 FL=1
MKTAFVFLFLIIITLFPLVSPGISGQEGPGTGVSPQNQEEEGEDLSTDKPSKIGRAHV